MPNRIVSIFAFRLFVFALLPFQCGQSIQYVRVSTRSIMTIKSLIYILPESRDARWGVGAWLNTCSARSCRDVTRRRTEGGGATSRVDAITLRLLWRHSHHLIRAICSLSWSVQLCRIETFANASRDFCSKTCPMIVENRKNPPPKNP